MKTDFHLMIDIRDFWHLGNGQEGGAYADALVLKDREHFPFLPGKSLKGLLKDAFKTAEVNQWFQGAPKNLTDLLFGDENREGQLAQGIIQVSDARLPKQDISAIIEHIKENHTRLREQDGSDIKEIESYASQLYRTQTSTAINPETGVADEGSLRSIEVVIPMILLADVSLNLHHPLIKHNQSPLSDTMQKHFGSWLENCLPLITHIGGKRRRGLGPVFISVVENQPEKK